MNFGVPLISFGVISLGVISFLAPLVSFWVLLDQFWAPLISLGVALGQVLGWPLTGFGLPLIT